MLDSDVLHYRVCITSARRTMLLTFATIGHCKSVVCKLWSLWLDPWNPKKTPSFISSALIIREVWLSENVEAGASVGVDPLLMTHNDWCRLYAALSEASVGLKPMTQNLVDKVWGPAQPSYPENPVRPLEMKFAGQHWEDKVTLTS